MNTNYDVVIVGAGPVGISTACLIKAQSKDLRVCVIDKRQQATREHNLKIGKDSIAKVMQALNKVQLNPLSEENQKILRLKQIFKNWENQFVRTNTIEATLSQLAKELGVEEYRSPEYIITKETLEDALKTESSEKNEHLRKIFKNAQVIIGADGTHSEIRKCVMQNQLADQKTYQYLIELNYQTENHVPPRKTKEALFKPFGGPVDFEIMGRKNDQGKKTVSYHVIVDKQTYEAFRENDQNGNLKGTYANPWNLEEIKKKAQSSKKIQRVYRSFQRNLKNLYERGGNASKKTISTLELAVYRSEKCVQKYQGKYFLLVGDASSGIIYQRGFNKGLKEAVLCSEAVDKFFKGQNCQAGLMPAPFINYEFQAKEIFKKENKKSLVKDIAIKIGSLIVDLVFALRDFYRKICYLEKLNTQRF